MSLTWFKPVTFRKVRSMVLEDRTEAVKKLVKKRKTSLSYVGEEYVEYDGDGSLVGI